MPQDSPVLQPFFSIILCTYNRARLLPRAIESVLTQSFNDWQLIVIDDGSSDDTQEVVMRYIASDARITYSYAANQGPALARNRGLQLAQGSYITFIDSDDEYLPDHLESRKLLLQADLSIDLLHGGIEVIGNAYVADRFDTTKLIHISECFAGGTFFIKRSLLSIVGGFRDLVYGDDSDFANRAIDSGAKVVKTEIPTYRYYRNIEDSLCNIAANEGEEGILSYRNVSTKK